MLPLAADAWSWIEVADDPLALARKQLDVEATPARLAIEIDSALAADDPDLADSLVALADTVGAPISAKQRAEVEAAGQPNLLALGGSFLNGAVFGETADVPGLAGAVAGDLVGIGDVRDFSRESWRYARGEDADEIVLALSAAGLAVTGATWASLGSAAPARVGLTALKSAKRAGRLSPVLLARLSRLAQQAIDHKALARSATAIGSLDLAAARVAARTAVRWDDLAPLAAVGRNTARMMSRAGYRAADDLLALARSPAEIARGARLADRYGDATRGVVRVLGRGAIVLTRALSELVGWVMAAAGWGLSLACWSAALGRSLARIIPKRRPKRPVPKPLDTAPMAFSPLLR